MTDLVTRFYPDKDFFTLITWKVTHVTFYSLLYIKKHAKGNRVWICGYVERISIYPHSHMGDVACWNRESSKLKSACLLVTFYQGKFGNSKSFYRDKKIVTFGGAILGDFVCLNRQQGNPRGTVFCHVSIFEHATSQTPKPTQTKPSQANSNGIPGLPFLYLRTCNNAGRWQTEPTEPTKPNQKSS